MESSNLRNKVSVIKGIGPKKTSLLHTLGIFTIQDLLEYYPFRYEDRSAQEATELIDGQKVTVCGVIAHQPRVERRGKSTRIVVTLKLDDRNKIQGVWFNQPYLSKLLVPNRRITITGKFSARYQQVSVSHHDFSSNISHEMVNGDTVVPIYPGTNQLSTEEIRKWIREAMATAMSSTDDVLPAYLKERYRLVDKHLAYLWIHFPSSAEELKQAKRRLIFEEFFHFQLQLQLFRLQYKNETKGLSRHIDRKQLELFIGSIEFNLTNAQHKAIEEIVSDMEQSRPMYRLLHGDVGAGKTIVATIALLANWTSQYQGALMAPTEIVAEQHYHTLMQLLQPLDLRICLLTSKYSKKERLQLLQDIRDNQYDLIVGTHALIQKDVEFATLGLVIIDEQHRFGVNQRESLTSKGNTPDFLSMTATPIPRTMAMTIFGDLDVSVLDELPAGRKKVLTYWYSMTKEQWVWEQLRTILQSNQQVYVVCPLIEESDVLDVENATDICQKIQQYFPDYQVNVIHGRLTSQIKEQVMREFVAGEIQILVATTVIEVGVNVPTASAIVIYSAERFGLAQLHQLRGRVGRSKQQAYCYLLADAHTQTGKERMKTMVESNDGFYIAEKDLTLRGPGEIFGYRQSGLPQFKLGNLVDDIKIMEIARSEAADFLAISNEIGPHKDHHSQQTIEFIEKNLTGKNFLA